MLVKRNQKNFAFQSLFNQLLRSATSIGANYIEANDSLGRKDFLLRLKISRKEAKEAIYWLKLLQKAIDDDLTFLISEATEIKNILSAIIIKTDSKKV